ncbi:hypothetical protein GE09DRAFT_69724 [Coniochaeta sp. 2T2.1]|nr:hypothetical protein GE09DRAFT_69724 [Coniochaeta sp. 2T2.1]
MVIPGTRPTVHLAASPLFANPLFGLPQDGQSGNWCYDQSSVFSAGAGDGDGDEDGDEDFIKKLGCCIRWTTAWSLHSDGSLPLLDQSPWLHVSIRRTRQSTILNLYPYHIFGPSLHNIATVYRFTATTVRPLQITTYSDCVRSFEADVDIEVSPWSVHRLDVWLDQPRGELEPGAETFGPPMAMSRPRAQLRPKVSRPGPLSRPEPHYPPLPRLPQRSFDRPREMLSGMPSTNTSRTLRLVTMKGKRR